MILAMDDAQIASESLRAGGSASKAPTSDKKIEQPGPGYHLVSYLLSLVEFSEKDNEILGYALFQGHLCVVEALLNRTSLDKAYLGYLTREHLVSLGRLNRQEADEYANDLSGPVNIALMSEDPKVIDYVANKYPIKSAEFVRATEFGKIGSMKHIYSPSIKPELQAAALAAALRNNWATGIEYLLERVPQSAYSKDTIMASLEYGDTKVFQYLLPRTTLSQEDLKEIAEEIIRGSYTKEMEILTQDSRYVSNSIGTGTKASVASSNGATGQIVISSVSPVIL